MIDAECMYMLSAKVNVSATVLGVLLLLVGLDFPTSVPSSLPVRRWGWSEGSPTRTLISKLSSNSVKIDALE